MQKKVSEIKKYYEDPGQYLVEHKDFFSTHNPEKDVDFLIEALNIKKNDNILDIACGQGRHTNEFAKRGYTISGVDFSSSLIAKAKQVAQKTEKKPKYYNQNIEALKLSCKFDVAYWFFSDFANINLLTAVEAISDHIKAGGKVLFDSDNLFRIANYLQKNPNSPYKFDAKLLRLVDDSKKTSVPYPTFLMWQDWLNKNGLTATKVWGNYDLTPYDIKSPRLIILANKKAT